MRKTLIAILLALALVVIPIGNAFAAPVPVTVTATPAVISFTAAPDWTINGILGSGSIWPNTTYYANPTGDETPPTTGTVVNGDCYFTFTNNSTVAIAITCDMTDFSGVGVDNMTNGDGGYTSNGPTSFGASGYASGDTWPGDAEDFLTTGSGVFIETLAGGAAIMWGVALLTQSNDFTDATSSTSTINCTATEP